MKNGNIDVKRADTPGHMKEIFGIRQRVFVEEQNVDPELEYDAFEETSHHYVALLEGRAAGTARWRTTAYGIKLERFAVLPEFRGNGVASALIMTILEDLPSKNKVYLHSQIQVCGLYAKFGFKEIGEQFEEAGIQHFKMELQQT